MAQAASLTSVNSVSESLALAFVRSDVPLVSAPIRPLYSVLVAMLLSIITSISSFCSQSLAVAHVLSRLQLLSAWSSTHTHTLTHCSSATHMTVELLCSTSALLELQVPELIAVVNVVYHLHFNSPLGLVHSIDDVTLASN